MPPPPTQRAMEADLVVVEPAELKCPITHELVRDPVTTAMGQTYERAALVQAWARMPRPRDPVTNQVLSTTALYPNLLARRQVRARVARREGGARAR